MNRKRIIISILMATMFVMIAFVPAIHNTSQNNINPAAVKANIKAHEWKIMSEKSLKINKISITNASTHDVCPTIGITNFLSNGKVSDRYFLINTTVNGKTDNVLFLTINSRNSTLYTIYTLHVDVLYSKTGLQSFTSTAKVSRTSLNSTTKGMEQPKTVNSIVSTPDISASAGWLGWAVSFSPSNMNGLAYAVYKDGTAGIYGAITAYVVSMGISGSLAGPLGVVAGIIAGVIVGIGYYYLDQYDMSHGNPGMYFAAFWGSPLNLDIWGLNPVPWYFS